MATSSLLSRIGPAIAVGLLGFALVLAALNAKPGPRVAGRARLIDLIAREDDRTRALRRELERLQVELRAKQMEEVRLEGRLTEIQREVDRLAVFAGLAPVVGPGLTVELRDSTLREAPTGDPNDLVIHEQDLQAVVNALWAGGAEAIAINGERITTASAVRCVGNTLLLHGSVYAPPYRISALGLPAKLRAGLDADPLVRRFTIFAEDFYLGFDVAEHASLRLPAFRGVVQARHAIA